MGKNLIILDTYNDELVSKIFSKYGEGKIISLRAEVSCSLELSNIKYEEFSHYSKKAFDPNNPYYKTSLQIAYGWYLESGQDFSEYSGTSIGNLLGQEMFYQIIGFLRFADGIDRLIEMESPSTVIFARKEGMENSYDKAHYICDKAKSLNINFEVVAMTNIPATRSPFNNIKLKLLSTLLKCSPVKWFVWLISKIYICPPSKTKKKILLASASSVNYLGTPLIKRLQEKFDLIVLDEFNLNQLKLKIKYDFLRGQQSINNNKEEWKAGFYAKLLNHQRQIEQLLNVKPRAEKVFNIIKSTVELKIDKSLFLIDAYNKYFQSNDISTILTHADTSYLEKLVVETGAKNNIKSIVVQHGTAEHSIGFFPLVADKICVWSESAKDWLLRNGVNPEKISVTGPARFDNISISQTTGVNKLSIDHEGNILLVLPSPADHVSSESEYQLDSANCIRAFKDIIGIMKKLPQKKLIVKTKQNDHMLGFYKGYISKNKLNNVIVTNRGNAADYLDKCDFIIVVSFSDVCFLAALNNKKILQVVYENPNYASNILYKSNILFSGYDNVPIYEIGASIKVDSPDILFPAVKKVYENIGGKSDDYPSLLKSMEKYCYKRDGKACERITNLVEELVNCK